MPTTTSPAPGALTTSFGQCVHTTEASGLTDEVRRYEVIRRTGDLTRFDASKIQVAMTKAFLAVEGNQAAASRRIHDIVEHLTAQVMEALFRRLPDGGAVHIEDIQDYVELALMRDGHHKVARAYVLYREERARQRVEPSAPPVLSVTRADGSKHPLDQERLTAVTEEACAGLAADLMVFDLARIGVTDDEVWHDGPAGTPRRVQGAEGVHHVVVNGQVVLDHNRPTGALPGRVLRSV